MALTQNEIDTLVGLGYTVPANPTPQQELALRGKLVAPGHTPRLLDSPTQPATQSILPQKTPDMSLILDELVKRALGKGGAVSSESSGITKIIEDVVARERRGREAAAARIESAFEREKSRVREEAKRAETAFLEASRGFSVNTAALNQIRADTERSIRDLEQRKQELLLAGDAESARMVNDMILQQVRFEIQARQQEFSNLLGLGKLALSAMAATAKSGLQASDVETFVDSMGNVVAKNKITGQTLWTAKGIGRAGSASPNITVSPIPDPVTGKFKYTEIRDKSTGKVKYLDAEGKEVPPAEVKIDKGDPFKALDPFLTEILNELGSGLFSE